MPGKLSRRVACAFCSEPTENVAIGHYVELEITVPESSGFQRQLLGAHVSCVSKSMRSGRQVEADLLIDASETGETPGSAALDPPSVE